MKTKIVRATRKREHVDAYVDLRMKLDFEISAGYKPRDDEKGILQDEFAEFLNETMDDLIFFAESRITPVGFVQFNVAPNRSARIDYLYVNQEFRGKGIGRQLVQRAINDSRYAGCSLIYLCPSDTSREFYERCGFRHFALGTKEMGLELKKDGPAKDILAEAGGKNELSKD